MLLRSDHAYTIGSTHDVCQDYATSDDEHGFAIISDGCSGSRNSQIGSMILAETAANMIVKLYPISTSFFPALINKADMVAVILNQKVECLDATLLGAVRLDNHINIFGAGDGYIVERDKESMIVHKFTSPSGYPNYPSYHLAHRTPEVEIDTRTLYEKHKYALEGDIAFLHEFGPVVMHEFNELVPVRPGMTVSVISDGAGAITDKERKTVSEYLVLRELTGFKGLKGRFVQRRLNGFMKKAAKQGWNCQDDISIATIHFEEENRSEGSGERQGTDEPK